MIISNYNNKAIKIQSQHLGKVLLSSSPDTSICITGKTDCDSESLSQCIDLANFWSVDLDTEVVSKMTIKDIVFRNSKTDKEFVIPINVDLFLTPSTLQLSTDSVIINGTSGIVNTPVTVIADDNWSIVDGHILPPTLEEIDGVTPLSQQLQNLSLIKARINNFFYSTGSIGEVEVTAILNLLKLSNPPEGFIPISISFVDSDTVKDVYYGLEEDVYILGDAVYIKPSFFNLTTVTDGIYNFELIGYDGEQYFKEENCAFIDVTIAAKVATNLRGLIEEYFNRSLIDKQSNSTYIFMLHYSLIESSNTRCSCRNLCDAYKELVLLLGTATNTLKNGCGC